MQNVINWFVKSPTDLKSVNVFVRGGYRQTGIACSWVVGVTTICDLEYSRTHSTGVLRPGDFSVTTRAHPTPWLRSASFEPAFVARDWEADRLPSTSTSSHRIIQFFMFHARCYSFSLRRVNPSVCVRRNRDIPACYRSAFNFPVDVLTRCRCCVRASLLQVYADFGLRSTCDRQLCAVLLIIIRTFAPQRLVVVSYTIDLRTFVHTVAVKQWRGNERNRSSSWYCSQQS